MKKILILGAGLVARPLVRYLAAHGNFDFTLASLYRADLDAAMEGISRGRRVVLDSADAPALEALAREADLVVSLLPATQHPRIAELCLRLGLHLATASYIGPEMAALDGPAKERGLVFLNECGLDPGLDHMSAMRVMDKARAAGGRITYFRSCCGGLPAPEANTNPLGYKFSWSPRGVLLAAANDALYREEGREVRLPGAELFAQTRTMEVPGGGMFEFYPNRDSLQYESLYGLEDIDTMYRGTFRNLGHCRSWYQWGRLGLFGREERDLTGYTHASFLRELAGGGAGDPRALCATHLGIPEDHPALEQLAWLGLFEDTPVAQEKGANLDVLGGRMQQLCRFGPGEPDMVVLHHEFGICRVDGTRVAAESTLVEYGQPDGESAMARTVSLPLAIAVVKILEGRLDLPGVHAPVLPEFYDPILDELAGLGITFQETDPS